MSYADRWTCVRVEIDAGIAWVELNRPEKRNAMNPTLNAEMVEVLLALDADDSAGVLVLTGAGDAWSAGMDLKEYFREVDGGPEHVQRRVRRDAAYWQWRLLRTYAKPTIAMVNGWCFGGAFTPLVACDLAIAANEATFGLSEINWGIPPGSVVSKALSDTVGSRAGLLYVMTGRTFDGAQAAEMGLVNASVPRAHLRAEVEQLARELLAKNPVVLRAAKLGYKHTGTMSWDQAEDYLYAKLEQSQFLDGEHGREQGLEQFLDEKRIKPGLQTYERPVERGDEVEAVRQQHGDAIARLDAAPAQQARPALARLAELAIGDPLLAGEQRRARRVRPHGVAQQAGEVAHGRRRLYGRS